MANLIGARYAHALFEAGLELNKLQEFKKDIKDITNLLKEEVSFRKILSHPKVSKNEKKDLLNSVFKDSVSEEVINFLYILIDKRREKFIIEINKEFEKLFNEHENIVDVTAITSIDMNDKAKKELTEALKNKLNKKVNLINVVDEDVIGGILLKIENKIVDGTIKGQLEEMQKAMKSASL